MTDSLAEALPREIKRCQELVDVYKSLGMPGRLGAMLITQDIYDATKAMAEQDTVAMIAAYQKLKECE